MVHASPVIAVVDDEEPVRVALGRIVRLAGYEVIAFSSGEDFLASLSDRRPDCVILDLHMPRLSGLEVQQRLRAGDVELPVVMITASDDVALGRIARDAGAERLLRKPFSSSDLLDAIDAALRCN